MNDQLTKELRSALDANMRACSAHCSRLRGLKAIAEGFRHLGFIDDHELLEHEFIVYDALYEYCKKQITRSIS